MFSQRPRSRSAKETLQRVCAAWVAALEVLQTKVPEQFLEEERSNLQKASLDRNLTHIHVMM